MTSKLRRGILKKGQNRRRGFSYERRRLREIRDAGGYGFRAYASKGIVDLVWVDKLGIAHLEQLKFSSKGKARISKDELADLKRFAERWRQCPCHVSLVLKNAWQEPEVIRLNG
jgi:Holliday junction resolvase